MDKNTAVWNWIQGYENIDKLYFNFGEFQNGANAIIPLPTDYVIFEDICGNKTRYYEFAVTVFKDFDTIPFGIGNVMSFEQVKDFMNWIDNQDKIKNYPLFEGFEVEKVENLQSDPTTSGYSDNLVKYMFNVRITYTEYDK